MTQRAIDFAQGFSLGLINRLKEHDVLLVGRYVGNPGWSKDLTAQELRAYHTAGIAVFFIFETTADWMLGGYAKGRVAATAAVKHVRQLGGPDHPTVYMAADFDVRAGEIDKVLATQKGANSVLGKGHRGMYGGGKLLTKAFDAGLIDHGFNAAATAWGPVDPRCGLVQVLGQQWGNLGIGYDTDHWRKLNVGQYPKPASPSHITVALDVPLDPWNHHTVWNRDWDKRKEWRPESGAPVPKVCHRVKIPVSVYTHRIRWNRGWKNRQEWLDS